jgi:hypothetical protein
MKPLLLEANGPLITTSADASNLIGAAWGRDVDTMVIPVSRLHAHFFNLSTGLAGEVLQKLTLHGLKLVVLGDVSAHVVKSAAFRDFVREANRGNHARFVTTEHEL